MKRLLKLIFPVVFLGMILFVMIDFRHLETLDARELRVIEEFRKRMRLEAEGGALKEGDREMNGNWSPSASAGGYFGTDYLAHPPGEGSADFTWTFEVEQTGDYQIFVNYSSAFDRATNAPYSVFFNGGQRKTIPVNQKRGGGEWVLLGTFSYQKGETGRVVLNNHADGFVIADAVKVLSVGNSSEKLILDNRSTVQKTEE